MRPPYYLLLISAGALSLPCRLPSAAVAVGPPAPALSRTEVERLLAEVNHHDAKVRELAARRLSGMPYVPLTLLQAANSSEQAARQRAQVVVTAIERRVAPFALARAMAWAKEGEVDLAREAVTIWGPRAGRDEGWQVMTTLAREILSRQEKLTEVIRLPAPARVKAFKHLKFVLPAGDFKRYQKAIEPKQLEGPKIVLDNGEYLVRTSGKVAFRAGFHTLKNSMVVHGEDFATPGEPGAAFGQRTHLLCCVIFTGGDVQVSACSDTLIISGGQVTLGGPTVNSVVINRGPMRIFEPITLNAGNVFLGGGKIEKPGKILSPHLILKENVSRPLDFVRFFETSRVGIETGPARNHAGARVTKLDASKGFARAGLWKDDVITAVDGAAIKSPEQFRRALLRRLVEGGEATLRINRDGEAFTVYVTPRL